MSTRFVVSCSITLLFRCFTPIALYYNWSLPVHTYISITSLCPLTTRPLFVCQRSRDRVSSPTRLCEMQAFFDRVSGTSEPAFVQRHRSSLSDCHRSLSCFSTRRHLIQINGDFWTIACAQEHSTMSRLVGLRREDSRSRRVRVAP